MAEMPFDPTSIHPAIKIERREFLMFASPRSREVPVVFHAYISKGLNEWPETALFGCLWEAIEWCIGKIGPIRWVVGSMHDESDKDGHWAVCWGTKISPDPKAYLSGPVAQVFLEEVK